MLRAAYDIPSTKARNEHTEHVQALDYYYLVAVAEYDGRQPKNKKKR
jgi:hypothetical protein